MLIDTDCSGCRIDVRVNILRGSGTVTATVASNGKRGSAHVPAHDVDGPAWVEDTTGLVMWDCPVCGYADSFDEGSL